MEERHRVLIASGDSGCRKRLKVILSEEQWAVVLESEGAEALVSILERPFDVAVIDLALSDMEGRQVVRIIRRSRPRVPLIVISDDPSVETRASIMQEGVVYYALKPLNPPEVLQALQAAVSLHRRGVYTRDR